jgi:quercetin dioxygenase-like cupin family protein
MFDLIEKTAFDKAYPDNTAMLGFAGGTPLLTRESLVGLANGLPADFVEFNAGDLPITVSPDNIPAAGMTATETIEKIGSANSWMVLRNIERDPRYADVMRQVLGTVGDTVARTTGDILREEAFVFISSPGAVTPFHMDEEHNILIQIEGRKEFTIYSQHDRELASQQDLEAFHSGAHRNLDASPEKLARGKAITMEPGDAIYVPPLAPHWVRVLGDEPSLSLSITWRSNASQRMCYLHQINHELRAQGGTPAFPGRNPVADQLKIWRASGKRRLARLFGAQPA